MNKLLTVVSAAVITSAAAQANAGGFLIPENSARATGRANAVTASVSDASAAYYNPGGLGLVQGIVINLGATLILPSSSFTEDGSNEETSVRDADAVTPNFYMAAQLSKVVRVGIGFNVPFGSQLNWPATSPAADEVRRISLRAAFITPVVGFDLGHIVPGLTAGVGIDLVPSTLELKRDIWFGEDTGKAHLAGSGFGVGARGGLTYRPPLTPGLSFGLAYRSQVAIDFEGDGSFAAPAPYRSSLPPDGVISTSITLPQSVLAGISYHVLPELEVEFDVNWVGWSSFDEVDLKLPDASHEILTQDYSDIFTLRAGAEYTIADAGVAVRGGYTYDPTPIPARHLTTLLPDIDRHVLAVGASYDRLPLGGTADLGVLWVLPGSKRTSDTLGEPDHKGSFDVSAWVVGLGYSMQLGRRPAKAASPRYVNAEKEAKRGGRVASGP